jgi:hypothetical protein
MILLRARDSYNGRESVSGKRCELNRSMPKTAGLSET